MLNVILTGLLNAVPIMVAFYDAGWYALDQRQLRDYLEFYTITHTPKES